MYKYLFFNDYSEGAHPKILEALQKTNLDQETGYGLDSISMKAADLIKAKCMADADVHFVSGGTQANLLMLAMMMRPHESVIAADTGHINVHEAGAIESTGHKINTVPNVNGKLTVEGIEAIVKSHRDEHMVKPKVVFVSQSTELGTIYSKQELEEISAYCRNNGIYLYLDGARLGSALCSKEADLDLADIAGLVDAFYIGGTKNGALLGEAIVIVNDDLKREFRYHLKQRGALLAKGRVLGAQFLALFEGDLYFQLAAHANAMADKLRDGIAEVGFGFLVRSSTNQVFPILPKKVIEELKELYGFYVWAKVGEENSAIRLVTSWATSGEKVEEFLQDLRARA